MILASQSASLGRHNGRAGGLRRGLCITFTNRVKFGPDGSFANGSFAASFRRSRAGQIMISHLNGSCRAIVERSVDSLTSLRTTKVPTAPILTTSNFRRFFAISAGRQRLAVPTLTARRKTTEAMRRSEVELLRGRDEVDDVDALVNGNRSEAVLGNEP